MKLFLSALALILTISYTVSESSLISDSAIPVLNVSMYENPNIKQTIALNRPYELAYSVEKSGKDQYLMITTMKLFGGSFLCVTTFDGRF